MAAMLPALMGRNGETTQTKTMTNKEKQAHVARIITSSHFSPRLVTLRKMRDCAKKFGFDHWNPAFRNLVKLHKRKQNR
jgi:hypothetical protein